MSYSHPKPNLIALTCYRCMHARGKEDEVRLPVCFIKWMRPLTRSSNTKRSLCNLHHTPLDHLGLLGYCDSRRNSNNYQNCSIQLSSYWTEGFPSSGNLSSSKLSSGILNSNKMICSNLSFIELISSNLKSSNLSSNRSNLSPGNLRSSKLSSSYLNSSNLSSSNRNLSSSNNLTSSSLSSSNSNLSTSIQPDFEQPKLIQTEHYPSYVNCF